MLEPYRLDEQAGFGVTRHQCGARLAALEKGLPGIHAEAALRFRGMATEALFLQQRLHAGLEELARGHWPRRADRDPAREGLELMGLYAISGWRHAHSTLDTLDGMEEDAVLRIAGLDRRSGLAALQ